MSFAGGVG